MIVALPGLFSYLFFVCFKHFTFLSTLLQDIHTTYIAFPFKIEALCSATHIPGTSGHKYLKHFFFYVFFTFTTGSETEDGIQIRALPHLNLKINGPHEGLCPLD